MTEQDGLPGSHLVGRTSLDRRTRWQSASVALQADQVPYVLIP